MVAGVIPFMIVKVSLNDALANPLLFHHYLGLFTFIIGTFIMLHCVVRFAIDGLGTLSPADPTKQLVISGLYTFTRNPMYVGVMLMLSGEVIFSLSIALLIYSIFIFCAFSVFIVYWEEPRLKNDFGADYETYCKKVRRWL